MAKTYVDLLEETLPSPTHKTYEMWKQCALDAVKRGHLVREIVSKFTSVDGVRVLDVGCGEGGISIAFSKEGKTEVYAFDRDHECVRRSKVRAKEEKVTIDFLIADGLNLPFKSGAFDIIICNDVIEHVPKPQRLAKEVHRNLNDRGFLYLSAPNGISLYSLIRDPHFNLFGVSLMPYRIGRYYVERIRKTSEAYNVYGPFSYWLLKGILSRQFNITECYKEYYSRKVKGVLKGFMKYFPKVMLRFIVPTLIFLCEKS